MQVYQTVQEIAETIKNCDTSHRLLMIEMDDIAIGEMSVRCYAMLPGRTRESEYADIFPPS